jgi:transcriptional regulator with XRE-family HTH domain
MSLLSKAGLLSRIRRSKQARTKLVASNLDKGIAFQIRATRDAQGWTQADLARETGMSQNNISRLESSDYGKHTISSLKRVAEALDVALVVRFVSYSRYIDWLSGTPRLDFGLNPESLAVPSFAEEESKGVLDIVGMSSPEVGAFSGRYYFQGVPLQSSVEFRSADLIHQGILSAPNAMAPPRLPPSSSLSPGWIEEEKRSA